MNVRDFLRKNGLKQVQLARYLDVTEAAISNVANGKSEFSEENLIKIMNNPHGWDVSMLNDTQSRDSKPELVAEYRPHLSDVEILLREMLAEERARVDALQERINELIEENARLKTLIEGERKGGIA